MNMGRILIVEDDESLRRVTQAQLEKSGYETSVPRTSRKPSKSCADSRRIW
jgi:CheY-like chemotaxis protein